MPTSDTLGLNNGGPIVLAATTNLGLELPVVGGSKNTWGNGSPEGAPLGLNRNFEILDLAVLDKRGGDTIAGDTTVASDALLDVRTDSDQSNAFRVSSSDGSNRVNQYLADVVGHGNGTLDFALNYNSVGGNVNLYINGADGKIHMPNGAVITGLDLTGGGTIAGEVTFEDNVTFKSSIILSGDAIFFPNKEPSALPQEDGATAFDSSRGLIIYRTQAVGQETPPGVFTILDTSNILGGNGITIENTAGGISGTEPIRFKIDTAWSDGRYPLKTGGTAENLTVDGLTVTNGATLNGTVNVTNTLNLNGTTNANGVLDVHGATSGSAGFRIYSSTDNSANPMQMYFDGTTFVMNYLNSGANDLEIDASGNITTRSGNFDVAGGELRIAGADVTTLFAEKQRVLGTSAWVNRNNVLGTVYTNSGTRLAKAAIVIVFGDNQSAQLEHRTSGGSWQTVCFNDARSGTSYQSWFIDLLPGESYRVVATAGSPTVISWRERGSIS